MYSSVEFAIPLAVGLVSFFVVERILSAVIGLFYYSGTGLKQAMSYQLLSMTFETGLSTVTSAAYAFVGLTSALTTALVWVSFLLLLSSVLYVSYEQAPWVWTDLARGYNATLGPFLNTTVVWALRILNVVFRGTVPLWNGTIFIVSRIMQGFVFPTLTTEILVVEQIGISLYSLCRHIVLAVFDWLNTLVVTCPEASGDACFDLAGRTLDLVTPLMDLRNTVMAVFTITGSVCDPLKPALDMVAYPLMDLNLARGLHNLVNAALYLVAQVPEVTHIRCSRHGSEGFLMCTPDLNPVFTFLVAGLRDVGRMLDNWLEVIFVIVQTVLGVSSGSDCQSVQLVPPVLLPGGLRTDLFGARQTAVVGLGGWLMAITDGAVIAYYGEGRMRAAAWATPVNITHGVAAVSYSGSAGKDTTRLSASVASGSTALFGCACAETQADGMQIQCSVQPYEGVLEGQASLVPVFFQQSAVEDALTCSDIDIVVQSVRWPATRFATTSTPLPDCASTRTCNQVDATVWVVPRAKCDAESTRCGCHPFCMAARLSGSQASALVLYSAAQWRSRVYVVKRDCNLGSELDGLTLSGSLGTAAVSSTQVGKARFVSGGAISCADNQLVTSIINRTAHPAYTNPTEAFLRKSDAPIAITGDTVLTSIRHGDGTYSVQVERLTGFSGSEFTLSVVTAHLPAYPPVNVPADLFAQYPKDHVTVPYARQATLAVSSRNYVFYAVNPAMQVYDAYLSYCRSDGVAVDKFGLIMTSSFSPIRIWRVEAYRRCTAAGCGPDLVKQADVPDAFSSGSGDGADLTWDCTRTYNEGITQLEYVNEANVAVTVRRTSVDASVLEYRTYWLHPDTMRLGQEPWAEDTSALALTAYTLCPSMQVLPDVGSLAAELLVAGVLLFKMPIDLITYMPGIGQLWSTGVICPLQTRGHSILEQCGSNALLLDDFFDALQAATDNFWSSLTLISMALRNSLPESRATDFVQNFLNGLARYGAGSIDLWTTYFGVLNVMKTGPLATIQALPTTVFAEEQQSKMLQGVFMVSSNGLAWARFGYTTVAKLVVTILQLALVNKPVTASGAWRLFMNTLDETRGLYGATVEASMLQSCAGVSLVFGLTNPWARLLYNQCVALKSMTSSGVDLTLAIFNMAPLAQCMCSGTSGKVFGEYAMTNCVPQAPTSLRPVLVEMLQSVRDSSGITPRPALLCQSMIDLTRRTVTASVQPWFDAQFASMDALGASLDFALGWLDPKAGVCLNYDEDPDVVVIMPFPADYFQACAATSLCRSKCAAVWDAFDARLASSNVKHSAQQVTVSAESLFFPSITLEVFNPMDVRAVSEPSQDFCTSACTSGEACLAVGGVAQATLAVQFYCVPKMLTSTVYRTKTAGLEWRAKDTQAWGNDVVQLRFADQDGLFLVAMTSTGKVWMASGTAVVELADKLSLTKVLGLPIVSILALQVMHRPGYASIHVNMLYRRADGRITAEPIHAKLVVATQSFPPENFAWLSAGVSFFSAIQGYSLTQVESTAFTGVPPTAEFLLLPTTEGLPMAIMTATWDLDALNGVVGWAPISALPQVPSGLTALLQAGQVLSQNCVRDREEAHIVYAAAPPTQSTTWLSQIRITGVAAELYHSQQVPVTVQTLIPCDVKSCSGCPDGEVQRLCDAVQQCAVVNCIGTPVNMRRVLCQMGQTMADHSRQMLAVMHGAWVIFVDIFMAVMDLSLQKGLTGVTMTWPDDSFFGYICTAKDSSAHFISIFTSAINSVLQVGHSAVVFLQGGAHTIDSNFHAMSTMPITALTSFLHQVFLLPLYPLVVAQKVVMCRVKGFLAIFDATGFSITLGSAELQDASSALTGHCLTANYEAQSANPADSGSLGMVAAMTQAAGREIMTVALEPVQHLLDGIISYLMGVILGLYDLVASLDMAHCKLPDYFLNETVRCACGDLPLAIPLTRRTEGVREGALWCSGTLSLLDASNRPFIVYNPFTFAELQGMASTSDAYLACVSSRQYTGKGSCDSFLPTTPALAAQGVSVLTVLTACKGNYLNMQWDKAAYILFNRSVFEREVVGASWPTYASLPEHMLAARDCLVQTSLSAACHGDFIRQEPSVYYSYQDTLAGSGSQYVDACQVFTGPANNTYVTSEQRSLFRACLDQYEDSNCQLSSNLWTPQSANIVPVAHMHAVKLTRAGSLVVDLKYQQANALVSAALAPLQDYSNSELTTIFFSPEGDIMHQMMDCVFMGPPNQVGYWPQDPQGPLPVPEWYRDTNGTSRAVDPRSCVKGSLDPSPPYSCGSPARQAVIKYFFRDYLVEQQNATIADIVRSMVGDLKKAWSNVSSYACACPDNRTHAPSCCTTDPGTWLPGELRVPYQTLAPNAILASLTFQLKQFYRTALEDPEVWTKYLDAPTLASYHWTSSVAGDAATEQAHFRTDQPVVSYDAGEVRSPMLTTALWHQCHGALSQIFFTVPLVWPDWLLRDRDAPSTIDGVDALDAYVAAAVRAAFKQSPLYRHYNVSYVPSASRLCRKQGPKGATASGKITVGGYTAAGVLLMNASKASFPVFGPDAFPLDACFCGWPGDGTSCSPPANACLDIPELCPTFPAASQAAVELLRARWSAAWLCPAANISDQWGLLDRLSMDAWLAKETVNFVVPGEDLLRRGRSGLRVGNVQGLAGQAMPPEKRSIEPMQASLPFCEDSFAKTQPESQQLRNMVEKLFPVAQGVYESGPTAYCLRYTIESALLQALQAAFDLSGGLGEALAAQRQVSEVWRRRCESQIGLLALCKGLQVFQPPVKISNRYYDCPFTITGTASNDIYMTPGCLVHSGGVFYDPCNCATFTCGPSKPLFNAFPPSCRISFDPRGMISEAASLGGWKVSPIEAFDRAALVDGVLGQRDSVGNVPRGGDWTRDHGFLNSTGRHCDMMADWWPEQETLPVGYHATTSCSSDDTGYRTFDSAFAVERTAGQFTVARLVYQNDLTRAAATVDTLAGGGGVCRASNLGLPMLKTNRVCLCTRQQVGNDTLDIAVPPHAPLYTTTPLPDALYGAEACAESSTEVGWFDVRGVQDSALNSVGTVPNMPSSSASTYPESLDHMHGVGPRTAMEAEGWGAGCSDFGVAECASTSDCPVDYICVASVCMFRDFKADTVDRCYRHDMCPQGLLCDGSGRCVQGSLYYLNTLPYPIEASVFSEQCDEVNSDKYFTDGASPWEYVQDWLGGHGMCSNKNWYKYSLDVQAARGCAGTCGTQDCLFDPRQCELSLNRSTWWPQLSAEPLQFKIRPTICDRDYEHLLGPNSLPMTGCRPKKSGQNTVTDWDGVKSELKYAGLFRNYDGAKTRLAVLPHLDAKKSGFLGLSEATLNTGSVLNCENFQNCYTYKFTYNGQQRARSYWQSGKKQDLPYPDADTFRCGVSAYYDADASKCRLDARAAHLHTALCSDTPAKRNCTCTNQVQDSLGCTPTVNKQKLERICSYVQVEFNANFETIQTNTQHLQELFNVFEMGDTTSLTSHISGTECFAQLHSSMQAAKYSTPAMGLYYPFAFALYEVPLAWVYQCSFLAGMKVDPTSLRQSCPYFENAKNMGDIRSSTTLDFNFIRAGYTRQQVLQRIDSVETAIGRAMPSIASLPEVRDRCEGMDGLDCGKVTMTPYCANRRDWILRDEILYNDELQLFLAAHYQLDCTGANIVQQILATNQVSYEGYISKYTNYKDYSRDTSLSGLPEVTALIKETLMSCVSKQYDVYKQWPFRVSFTTADKRETCYRESLRDVLNKLTTKLIVEGMPYSDYNVAYMPSSNIRDMDIPIPPIDFEHSSTMDFAKFKCIYSDPNEQRTLLGLTTNSDTCSFYGESWQCAGTNCMAYPLTYMHGTQNCSYPLRAPYTSLSALLVYVWQAMQAQFSDSFDSMYSDNAGGERPQELPFFSNVSTTFDGWRFDTSDVKRYMSNINPDTNKEVMCVISDAIIDYTTCNDDNFAALKAFTESLRQTGAPIVPPNQTLEWKVSREFLARGGVLGFASTDRPQEKVLLRNLFDESLRCGQGESVYNRVCLQRNLNVRPFVPWMSGDWNPYEMCDVRRLDLDQGNQEEIWPYDLTQCKACKDVTGQYRTQYMYDPKGQCDAKQNTYATFVNVEASAPSNLCQIRMRDQDQTCAHPHGMLGGGRGQSVLNHPQVSHLYGTNNVTGWPRQGGIFPRGDPLLRGGDADETAYGIFTVPGDELGLASIGLATTSVAGSDMPYLRVARLPLMREEGYMPNWVSQDVANWTMGLQAAFEAEHAAHASEQASRVNTAWDCPLRRAAYYSRALPDDAQFSPAMPSPGRARRLFGHLTGGLSSHPTQTMQRNVSGMGNYTTSNGFCFCPDSMQFDQRQCLVALSNTNHPCSLTRTIKALLGEWTQSHVFTPQTDTGDSPCQMQFDWPYVNGLLRDGQQVQGDYTWASNRAQERCHVLDRLKPFQYRYKADRPAEAVPGTSTTDQGGVCHTGRAAVLTRQASKTLETTRCVKASEDSTAIQVQCEDGSTLSLSKERSTPLPEMLEAAKKSRRRCDTCSPPPAFFNSQNKSIPAESSFGIPFRFSASRMLKEDLLMALGNSSGLPMNSTAWAAENFMGALLTAPGSLFLAPPLPETPTDTQSTWPKGGWVFCNTTEALRQGQCEGGIPEASWKQDRFQACYNSMKGTQQLSATMAPVDVCLMDSRLQDLCVAVDKAQALVRQGNCLASGSDECALQPFVYQPSAWDVSNREFVKQTVTQFYQRIAPAACPERAQAIQENNNAAMSRCAATPFGALFFALQGCRDIVDALSKVVFYMLSIVVNGLMLAFTAQRDFLIAQIVYYWDCIVTEMRSLLEVLGNIIFKMLFSMGSLGVRIYNFLIRLCGLTNTAFQYWMEMWCTISLDLAPATLGGLRAGVEFCETGFGVLNGALDSIFLALGPKALGTMIEKGFDYTFRDKSSQLQQQQRQESADSAKKSVKEGKKKGGFTVLESLGLATAAGASLTQLVIFAGVSDVAKNALENSPLGFLVSLSDSIWNVIEADRLSKLYPSNWTLFSFSPIYVALDFMEAFISSDERCLTYRSTNATDIISCKFEDLTSAAAVQGALLVATRCWADAQRMVGVSSLLACTESDTCYQSLYDRTTPIVCGACPLRDAGISTFGCSPITKMCTCGVPSLRASGCGSNSECAYETTVCQLVTGVDTMSYGNQPCTDCSKDVQCLSRGGETGKCGCLFQAQPQQRCTQMPGQRVYMTDPNRMCGYLPNADRSMPLTAVQWDELTMVECIYLNPALVYCTQVYQRGTPAPLAVGVEMAPISTAFQSRRLLSMPEAPPSGGAEPDSDFLLEDWNATAEPCRSLAKAYQLAGGGTLGPTDTERLHLCAYWRMVGRRTIEHYNLTALKGRETFLLSSDDFSEALLQRWVLVQLLGKPQALLYAFSHWPALKPLHAALLVVRSASMAWGMRSLSEIRYRRRMNVTFPPPLPVENETESTEEEQTKEDFEEEPVEDTGNRTSRRLLQTQTDIKFAETWLAGPFTWPPPFVTKLGSFQCSAATAILQIGYELVSVLATYYRGTYTIAPNVSKRVVDNLPNLTRSSKLQAVPAASDSWVASTYHAVWSLAGIEPAIVRELFSAESSTNIFTITTSMLKCDFSGVTFCSKRRKDLFASIIILLVFYLILSYFGQLMGVPYVGTALALSFVPVLLWYTYGMALTCAPMLPTCLLDDVVDLADSIFPLKVAFPASLQTSPDCLADPTKASCLLRCSEPPMLFVDWRDTLAFAVCYSSQSFCLSLAETIGELDPMGAKLVAKSMVLDDEALLSASLFCFGVTFVNVVPVLILLVVAATLGGYLFYLPCVLLPKLFSLAAQSMVYLHAEVHTE